MADPLALLTAFLTVHAQGAPLPAALYAKGDALWQDLREHPPVSPLWGRFLVAMGELAINHLEDGRAAFGFFQSALLSVRDHGDAEVGATAGYNLAAMTERRGDSAKARTAYRETAHSASQAGSWCLAAIAASEAAARLAIERDDALVPEEAGLLKQAWMAWFSGPPSGTGPALPADLTDRLQRSLAALLLPEDDPSLLAEHWCRWPPHTCHLGDTTLHDHDPALITALYNQAILAAENYLHDEPSNSPAAYRLLQQAHQRLLSK